MRCRRGCYNIIYLSSTILYAYRLKYIRSSLRALKMMQTPSPRSQVHLMPILTLEVFSHTENRGEYTLRTRKMPSQVITLTSCSPLKLKKLPLIVLGWIPISSSTQMLGSKVSKLVHGLLENLMQKKITAPFLYYLPIFWWLKTSEFQPMQMTRNCEIYSTQWMKLQKTKSLI